MIESLIPFDDEIIASYFLLVIGAGIFVSFKLGFPQIRYLLLSLKIFTGALDDKGSKGQIIHSQSFYAASASSLLFGAVVGSAFAFGIGGIGVLPWIWLSAFIAMPLRAVSSTLALKFRTKLPNGRYLAGPMYFIEKALRANWLAIVFALTSLGTVFTLGALIPVSSMTYISQKAFNTRGFIVPVFVGALLIYVSLGGIRRVGRLAGFLVPLSLVLFFAGYFSYFRESLGSFTEFLRLAFINSFNMESIAAGGFSGALILIAQSSGAFLAAAETGIGKSAGISGVVRTDYPFKHGLVSMLSIFFEAFIIATLIGYLLYSNNAVNTSDQSAFLNSIFRDSRNPGAVLLIASFLSLGFVSVCSWFYTGQQNAYYILGEKFANFYRILFIGVIGASSYFYIRLGDSILFPAFQTGYLMAVLTAIPVLVSLVILVKTVSAEMKKYVSESEVSYEVFKDFYLLVLTLLPKNLISKVFGMFTYAKLPRFMIIPILKAFAKMYKINVSEAELNIQEYSSLNEFFTRALKAGARIIDSAENAAVSPVDARITSFGEINEETLIQAKGIDYSLKELLGSEKYYPFFENGKFITFYLSPQDYHRIHSPFYGQILGYYYAPGKLFPVNDMAVLGIKSLFPKNERLITFLQTEYGKIAVVKVGASNVGKIRVTYDTKIVTNSWIRLPKEYEYTNVNIFIDKGSELGRFEMGSTVILVFEKDSIDLAALKSDEKCQYGSTIGYFKKKQISLPK